MTIYHRILEEKDPETEEIKKYLDVTTLIENNMAMFDEGLTYKDGHIYQAWIQFKDPSKAVELDINFPASDANKPKTDAEKEKEAEKKKDEDDHSE